MHGRCFERERELFLTRHMILRKTLRWLRRIFIFCFCCCQNINLFRKYCLTYVCPDMAEYFPQHWFYWLDRSNKSLLNSHQQPVPTNKPIDMQRLKTCWHVFRNYEKIVPFWLWNFTVYKNMFALIVKYCFFKTNEASIAHLDGKKMSDTNGEMVQNLNNSV